MKRDKNTSTRRRFSPAEKSKILKQHFVEGKAISDVCEEHQIAASQFYQWQNQLFTKADTAFETKRGPKPKDGSEQIRQLEAKVRQKDEVIAELMAEYLKAKKKTGDHS